MRSGGLSLRRRSVSLQHRHPDVLTQGRRARVDRTLSEPSIYRPTQRYCQRGDFIPPASARGSTHPGSALRSSRAEPGNRLARARPCRPRARPRSAQAASGPRHDLVARRPGDLLFGTRADRAAGAAKIPARRGRSRRCGPGGVRRPDGRSHARSQFRRRLFARSFAKCRVAHERGSAAKNASSHSEHDDLAGIEGFPEARRLRDDPEFDAPKGRPRFSDASGEEADAPKGRATF
jgi:hypothetical protein